MPIYEYRCDNEHRFEVFQPMADDSLDECEVCGSPAQRVLSAPAVHFKGSGFYTTDYAKKKSAGGSETKSDSGNGSESSDAKKSDSSSDTKKSEGSSSSPSSKTSD